MAKYQFPDAPRRDAQDFVSWWPLRRATTPLLPRDLSISRTDSAPVHPCNVQRIFAHWSVLC